MLLILDGNNLAWAGYYALERAMKPEDDERRERVALLGLSSMALGAIARAGEPPNAEGRVKLTGVAICFDEGRPLRRRQVYPAYQTGREGDPKFMTNEPTILRAVATFCKMASKMLPVDVLQLKNTEADDLISGLIHRDAKQRARIVSSDRDFLQLISSKVSVYSPIKKVVVDEDNFFDQAAPRNSSKQPVTFPRERFLDYRALSGDPSDNLPGVPGVGPLTAAALVKAAAVDTYFGDALAVRAALGRKSDAVERAFAGAMAKAIVERNRLLMDLRLPAPCWDELDKATTRGTWDQQAFEAWIAEQRLTTVDVPMFVRRMEEL